MEICNQEGDIPVWADQVGESGGLNKGCNQGVGLLESAAWKGWYTPPKAKYNGGRPIANKYREGKIKRTLKRELKELEVVEREAIAFSISVTIIVLF